MSDRILGGLGLLLSIGMIYAATQLPVPFISDPVGSKTFPIIVAIVLGLASLFILLRPDPAPMWPQMGRLVEIAAAVAGVAGAASATAGSARRASGAHPVRGWSGSRTGKAGMPGEGVPAQFFYVGRITR